MWKSTKKESQVQTFQRIVTSRNVTQAKANLTAEGHRLDNLPVPSMPWRPCTDLCFF